VATGAAAIARVRARAFDAITLDLLLPDMNGQDVLRAIRAEGPNRETPVIIATVVSERGLAAGYRVADVLMKPIDPAELLAGLARARIAADGSRPILVIDDDPKALKLAERSLRDGGFRPILRSDAEGGLQAVEKETPAAIVVDLVMPGMSGFDFMDRLAGQPRASRIPVIVWTEKDMTAEEQRRLADIAEAVVLKRAGTKSLVDELRRHVGPGRRPSS
jgi:CheY-like chemotaxis protein